MSGTGDDEALRGFGDTRSAGFVPKPFSPDQLAQAVAVARQRIARWAGKDRRAAPEGEYPGRNRRGEPVRS